MTRFYLLLAIMLLSGSAWAGIETISTPSATKGALEIEVGNAYFDQGDSEHAVQALYGFTDWVKAGLEFTAERQRWNGEGRELRYALTDLKGTFAFAEQSDQLPVSIGMRLQYGFSTVGGPDEIDARLLLRREDGPMDLVTNLGVEHEVGERARGGLGLDLRGSTRFWVLADGQLAPAIDYLGSTGNLRDLDGFDNQRHRMGPAFYGDFNNGPLKDFAFDAGLLFGLSQEAPSQSVKLNLRYSF